MRLRLFYILEFSKTSIKMYSCRACHTRIHNSCIHIIYKRSGNGPRKIAQVTALAVHCGAPLNLVVCCTQVRCLYVREY